MFSCYIFIFNCKFQYFNSFLRQYLQFFKYIFYEFLGTFFPSSNYNIGMAKDLEKNNHTGVGHAAYSLGSSRDKCILDDVHERHAYIYIVIQYTKSVSNIFSYLFYTLERAFFYDIIYIFLWMGIYAIMILTFFNKFLAIGTPMFPRPTKPTFDFHRVFAFETHLLHSDANTSANRYKIRCKHIPYPHRAQV